MPCEIVQLKRNVTGQLTCVSKQELSRLYDAERRLAELVEAVRWERECCQDIRPLTAWADLYARHGEAYVDDVAEDLRAIQDAARAAVDALVGEE